MLQNIFYFGDPPSPKRDFALLDYYEYSILREQKRVSKSDWFDRRRTGEGVQLRSATNYFQNNNLFLDEKRICMTRQ